MIADQAGLTVWKWDNTEPFGNSMPNDDPDGDGVPFVFDLRFPGSISTGRRISRITGDATTTRASVDMSRATRSGWTAALTRMRTF